MATISMKCKDCGGTLDVDESQNVMFCPYCGSKELILESDEVKKERIKYEAVKDISLGRKEIERQIKLDEIENNNRRKKEEIHRLRVTTIIFLVVVAALVLYFRLT